MSTSVDERALSFSEEVVRKLFSEAHCLFYAGEKLDLPNNGTGGRILKRLIELYSIDTSHFDRGKKNRKYKWVTKNCPVCQTPFQITTSPKWNKETCSYACANTLFRSGDENGMRSKSLEDIANGTKQESYASVCWRHHERECIVCGESLVVAVHHYNENHEDNRPENLVPLCPTHHLYWHSKHKHLIQETVDKYVSEFIRKNT